LVEEGQGAALDPLGPWAPDPLSFSRARAIDHHTA